jgi:hypothetical protein
MKYCILFLATLFIQGAYAQSNFNLAEIKMLSDSVVRGSTDSLKNSCNERLLVLFDSLLNNKETFATNFDSAKSISVITSPDNTFRFYQWAMPVYENNTYKYFGFIQTYNSKKKTVQHFKLTEGMFENKNAVAQQLAASNWYGAIYYTIIPTKVDKKKVYTLLGWRGNNLKTTIKVIDVLSFDNDVPKFGMKLFSAEGKMLQMGSPAKSFRIIFEYNATASISLKYYKRKKQIVFDHIAPSKPSQKGMEEFYGPDFTLDAFIWKKGKWNGKTNIEMRNENNTDGNKNAKLTKDSDIKE